MIQKELIVIGGGPAGMAAAVAAKESGIHDILILEREDTLGGILNQCIHNGFGLHRFGEELTGPEYALREQDRVRELGIPCKTGTTVLSISKDKVVRFTNEKDGICEVEARAVILAMGCRERPRGALNISGTRPSGIFSAGTAQKYVNRKGMLPGRDVVILGSGDIGLIMARRMTLEGARVHAVCELMPYSGGLKRNIEQCLNDFGIPLLLSHTVVEIHGKERLTGVTVARVDENRRPISGSERHIACDTLLLSVGLLPENELTKGMGLSLDPITGGVAVDENRETELSGVFSAGNALHVHDLVDYVSEEAATAGRAAAAYLREGRKAAEAIPVEVDGKIRYSVPQRITGARDATLYFRVANVYRNVTLSVYDESGKCRLSKKRAHCAPGEMEKLALPISALEGAKRLFVKLEESEGGA